MIIEPTHLTDLAPHPQNPRAISDDALAGLGKSITRFGDLSGIVFNTRTGTLVCGHQRCKSLAEKHGNIEIKDGCITTPDGHRFPVRLVDWDDATHKAAMVAANSRHIAGEWTPDLSGMLDDLAVHFDEFIDLRLGELRLDIPDLLPLENGNADEARTTLAERFLVPPFSVLDARQGYWQDRKRAWLALGIQSELGRGGAPGGSPRPAARLTASGHTVRGDGKGRAL